MDKKRVDYTCEDCKKTFKAPENRLSLWTRCDCGGRAFSEGKMIVKFSGSGGNSHQGWH